MGSPTTWRESAKMRQVTTRRDGLPTRSRFRGQPRPSHGTRIILQIVVSVCCLAAAVISFNLLLKHLSGSSGQAWFEAGCSDEVGLSRANCAAVLATPYSYFPPKRPRESSERKHIPVAFLGLLYYSTLLIWIIGVGAPSRERRWVHAAPLVLVEFGIPASVYYSVIMFRVLDEWCPWCLVTHILNLVIATCLALMWPRARESGASGTGRGAGESASQASPHPSIRTVLLTVGVIALAVYGHFGMLGSKTSQQKADVLRSNYDACRSVVKRIKRDTDKLITMWHGAKPCEISIRADDPVRLRAARTDRHPPLTMVVFSDFECPSCARFAIMLEERIQPLFDGHLRIIYKYYPLDRLCNKRIMRTAHPHACVAARMAEAARLLRGNDGFWEAHDYLYHNRDDTEQGRMTPERVAAELDLDVDELRQVMEREEILQRIAEDVRQAKACGSHGTPTVFVDGKPVEPLAIMQIASWDKMADLNWQRINVPRPERSKLPAIRRVDG